MIIIRQLEQFNVDNYYRLETGYITRSRYSVVKTESEETTEILLQKRLLQQPYRKVFGELDSESLIRYQSLPDLGFSYEAYNDDLLVGIALAEPRLWNRSLWVWEFHVAKTHQGKGIGRRMMEVLEVKCKQAGLRTMVCETQTTNVPAIGFYRKMGFSIEGIDLSYYTNQDYPDGEVALFMKKRIE